MGRVSFGSKIFRLDTVSSTQDALKEQFNSGAREGTLIIANEQSHGRGRHGRSWESPAGKGLWVSTLVVPDAPETSWGWVSLWAGVVMRSAIMELVGSPEISENLFMKWPNDLVWGDQKLGGILAEVVRDKKERQAIALGMGVNLMQHGLDFPPHLQKSAISLRSITGERFAPDALLEKLIVSLEDKCNWLKPVSVDKIQQAWLTHAWGLNEDLQVFSGEKVYSGTFVGLGSFGEISIKRKTGEIVNIATTDCIRRVKDYE